MHTKASKWHRHRNIQRVSTITTQLLTIMRPRITIIRRNIITRSASMKRPRSTPRQLRSIASSPTSIRRTLTRTLINDVAAGAAAAVLRPPLEAASGVQGWALVRLTSGYWHRPALTKKAPASGLVRRLTSATGCSGATATVGDRSAGARTAKNKPVN
jgi:hypothetical protein